MQDVMLPGPGQYDTHTVLNVLSEDSMGTRIMFDPLNCGGKPPRFYSPTDLAIGAAVNVMGRKVVLCDCDKYTQEYYRTNYGIGINADFLNFPPFLLFSFAFCTSGSGTFQIHLSLCLIRTTGKDTRWNIKTVLLYTSPSPRD